MAKQLVPMTTDLVKVLDHLSNDLGKTGKVVRIGSFTHAANVGVLFPGQAGTRFFSPDQLEVQGQGEAPATAEEAPSAFSPAEALSRAWKLLEAAGWSRATDKDTWGGLHLPHKYGEAGLVPDHAAAYFEFAVKRGWAAVTLKADNPATLLQLVERLTSG